MPATSELLLADDAAYADLKTFVSRARAVHADAAVRLQALGPVVAVYAGLLPGSGLLGEGAVLALRVAQLAEAADLDTTVASASLADRFARTPTGSRLAVPPTSVHAAWAAVTPPRAGWQVVRELSAELVHESARTAPAPQESPLGPVPLGPVPAGLPEPGPSGDDASLWPPQAAVAAHRMGFVVAPEPVAVLRNGRWWRLSTSRGHILAR